MIAKYKGICAVCDKAIAVGDEITWSRQERGKVYHTGCAPKREAGTDSAVHKEIAAIREMLAKLAASTPVTSPATVATVAPSPVACVAPSALAAVAVESAVDSTVESSPKAKTTVLVESSPRHAAAPKLALAPNSKWWDTFAAVLPHTNRILLIGPPSSGKSTTAILTAKTQYRLTMTETTSREDLIGMFHLVDGETKWIDGPVTCAMRNGEPVLIDEIDRYSPECASLLYSLIDDSPHVSLPTSELVAAREGYKVIMTSNEGIETLPLAVQDRIEVIIMASDPHPDALREIPAAQRNVVARYYRSQPTRSVSLPPTVRRMRAFHRLIGVGIPSEVAGTLVFGENGRDEVLSAITSAEGNPDVEF